MYISDLPMSLTQLSQGKISLRAKHNCRLDRMLQVRMGVGGGEEDSILCKCQKADVVHMKLQLEQLVHRWIHRSNSI